MLQAEIKSKADEDVCMIIKALHQKLHYMCDCGFASKLSIRDCKNIKALFISHTHIDHFCNFDTVLRHQLPIGREVIICGPEGLSKNVQAKLRSYNWETLAVDDKAVSYQVREISENQIVRYYRLESPLWKIKFLKKTQNKAVYQDKAITVKTTLLNHNIPLAAYRFEGKKRLNIKAFPFKAGAWINDLKDAFLAQDSKKKIEIEDKNYQAQDLFQYLEEKEGSSIAFVMDHQASKENHQRIIELCKNVEELYIECYYPNSEKDLAWKNHHSTAYFSGEVARKAQAQKVIPMHFSRRYKGQDVEDLKNECLRGFEKRE